MVCRVVTCHHTSAIHDIPGVATWSFANYDRKTDPTGCTCTFFLWYFVVSRNIEQGNWQQTDCRTHSSRVTHFVAVHMPLWLPAPAQTKHEIFGGAVMSPSKAAFYQTTAEAKASPVKHSRVPWHVYLMSDAEFRWTVTSSAEHVATCFSQQLARGNTPPASPVVHKETSDCLNLNPQQYF